jgi:hypothetical protein
MVRRRAVALLASCATFAASTCARSVAAEPSRPGAAFGSEAGEVGLALACGATLAARFLPQQTSEWGPSHAAEFAFDTSLVSDFVGAGIGSVLQIGAGYGFETAYLASHGDRQPAVGALRTSVIDVEALMLSGGLTYAVKRFAGRCRPRAFVNGKCQDEYDAFPSGHTSAVGSMGGARLVTVLRGDPDDDNAGLRWAAFAIAETSIVVTGALRVGAHAHSWEDVVGGAILGHAAGALVAFLHPEEPLDVQTASARRSLRTSSSSMRAASARRPPGGLPVPLAIGWGTAF